MTCKSPKVKQFALGKSGSGIKRMSQWSFGGKQFTEISFKSWMTSQKMVNPIHGLNGKTGYNGKMSFELKKLKGSADVTAHVCAFNARGTLKWNKSSHISKAGSAKLS